MKKFTFGVVVVLSALLSGCQGQSRSAKQKQTVQISEQASRLILKRRAEYYHYEDSIRQWKADSAAIAATYARFPLPRR